MDALHARLLHESLHLGLAFSFLKHEVVIRLLACTVLIRGCRSRAREAGGGTFAFLYLVVHLLPMAHHSLEYFSEINLLLAFRLLASPKLYLNIQERLLLFATILHAFKQVLLLDGRLVGQGYRQALLS